VLAGILAAVGGNRSPGQLGAIERLGDRLAVGEELLAATVAGVAVRRAWGELRFAREPGRAPIAAVEVAPHTSVDWDGRFRIANRQAVPVAVRMASGLSRRDAEKIVGCALSTPALAIRAAPLVSRADGTVLALGTLSIEATVEVKFFVTGRGKNAT
jgi:hypothetical protein